MNASYTVRVPASTSNLGSGFDTVSAALSLYLSVAVELTGSRTIEWISGWESDQPNILDRALRVGLQSADQQEFGCRLRMQNPIPLGRGLGSSGAAIIAGLKISELLSQSTFSETQILELAFPLEGHPENLAASLLGGWVISRTSAQKVRSERVPAALDCRFAVAIPDLTVSTAQARSILPASYPLGDVVYNLQRCALLVYALLEDRSDLIEEALEDTLHQPYRRRLIPGMSQVLDRQHLDESLAGDLLGVAISGSGPCLIALTAAHPDEIGEWMVRCLAGEGTRARSIVLTLDRSGATVHSH